MSDMKMQGPPSDMNKTREIKFGRGPHHMGPKPKIENPGLILKRLYKYSFAHYKLFMILVLAGILISVFCTIRGTMFTKQLVDVYITPMIGQKNPDFKPLQKAILKTPQTVLP